MPRHYKAKGGLGGRPPIEDTRLARALLFATRIMGRDKEAMTRNATRMLIEARESDLQDAEARGLRKLPIGRDSARRRVNENVAQELRLQGDTPLTGLPPELRRAGQSLATIAARDGYAAARQTLVEAIAIDLAWGQISDHDISCDCMEAADMYVTWIEQQFPLGGREFPLGAAGEGC